MRTAWRMLAAAVLAQLGSAVVEQGLPTLTGFIKQDLALSAAAAGLIASSINVGRALGAFRAGRAADDFGERRVLVVGGTVAGLLAITAVTLPLAALVGTLVVTGVFVSAATPAGGKFVMRAFPLTHRALALGIRQTGTPLGGILAAAVLPLIANAWGWRTALGIAGAFAALTAVAVIPLGGSSPGVESSRAGAADQRGTSFRQLMHEREIVLITIWAAVMVSAQYAFVSFVGLDAAQRARLPLAHAVLVVAIAQAGGVVGRVGWGLVSDRLMHGARRPVLLVVTALAVASAAALALTPAHASFLAFVVLGAVGGLSIIGWQGMWMTTLSEHAGALRAGSATGFSLTFVTIASAASPPLYGLIHDLAGTFRASWAVLACFIAASVIPLARTADADRG